MPKRAGAAAALITIVVLAASGAQASPGDGGRVPAKAKDCGTYDSTSIYDRAKVVAIRGVGCKKAEEGRPPLRPEGEGDRPRRCALGHDTRVLFSCGHPQGGNLRDADHALKAVGLGQPSCRYSTVSVPSMPPSRWPATEQKNV